MSMWCKHKVLSLEVLPLLVVNFFLLKVVCISFHVWHQAFKQQEIKKIGTLSDLITISFSDMLLFV